MNCLRYCLVALIWLSFGAAQSQDEQILRVGSKRFTESYILAAMIAQTANQATKSSGTKTEVFQGLGNTAIVFEALKSSKIDVYVEYTGTIATEILKSSPAIGLPLMQEQLAKLGFGASASLGFNNGYALAMRAADADRLGILSLSDLAKHPNLKLGLSNEFMGRQDGWQGLTAKYQLPQKPTGLDHGLAYSALENKQIDVMDIYTTDAKINHLELRVLQDDQNYFPRYVNRDTITQWELGR